jgi:hypothetical protein
MHHRRRTVLAATLGALVGAGATVFSESVAQEDPPVRVVLARAVAYLEEYRRAFAFLVADEDYVQQAAGTSAGAPPQPVRRHLRGEMFLTYLGADRRWIALHDVAEVDGVPVAGRERLRALLETSDTNSVAGRLYRYNARFNLGGVTRTFNEPTLALQVLDDAHRARFRFRIERMDRSGPDPIIRLAFQERDRPTLVRSLQGGAVFSSGTIDVDAERGTIRGTRIVFRHDGIDAELVTHFEHDTRLELWVPSLLTERYVADAREDRPAENITAEARYDNYRRFEGRARMAIDEP